MDPIVHLDKHAVYKLLSFHDPVYHTGYHCLLVYV